MTGALPHLALFFTRGMSLIRWDELGLLDREMALYQRLQERGMMISLVTHGTRTDLDFRSRFAEMHILCNSTGLPGKLYRPLLPWIHRSNLRQSDVIKTNQMLGADIALRAAKGLGKPLIARCGFMLSKNVILEHGEESPKAKHALALEAEVFSSAARITVTSEEMKRDIENRLPHAASKVTIIPNYVDTAMFSPSNVPKPHTPKICFVGRLAQEKNIPALIVAIQGMDVDLDIIGDGALRRELDELTRGNPRIRLLGSVKHADLPVHLNSASIFILPSHYEGHPKTLIEAMSCGLPVIGSRIGGIRDLIEDEKTGLLCDTDARSIRAAIQRLIADADLRRTLGAAARNYVLEHFSLDRIVEMEIDQIQGVMSK